MLFWDDKQISVAAIDVDGTIKDLVKESTDALIVAMKNMNNINLKLRGRFVLILNRLNMYFVKTGLLPTNKIMQNILLFIYSVLLCKNYAKFRKEYFKEYNKEHVFFNNVDSMLESIYKSKKDIYLITKNDQNRNITDCYEVRYVKTITISKKRGAKKLMYKRFMKKHNLKNSEIVIIGDNFWDDVFPAIIMGINVVWCNMYDCKLKAVAIKVVKLFSKKVQSI